MNRIIWAAAFAVFAAVIGVSANQPAQAQTNVIIFRVCNNTGDTAQVAVSYKPVNAAAFYNEGWFNVGPRQCEELARTTNAYIYAYAEVADTDEFFWAGDHPRCVAYPGPYGFWDTHSTYCETNQEVRDFVAMHADDWGTFTWNLDPAEGGRK